MKKKALLAVSFGTSYSENREKTIGAVERALQNAFRDYDVKRAFTSRMIIKKLKERDGLIIDDLEQAVNRILDSGYEELLIQPTYVMSGIEYGEMVKAAERFRDSFSAFAIGLPLLSREEDDDRVVKIMAKETQAYAGCKTAFVLMGHGTEHSANEVYRRLSRKFVSAGCPKYLVGTVEEPIELEEVKDRLKELGAKKAVLLPLMIVAGDHAHNDMAGEDEGSWRKEFEKEGYEVTCLIRGLGEYEGICSIFVQHAAEAARFAQSGFTDTSLQETGALNI